MKAIYKLPLVFDPQPEGGYTVTCPILPELITEGDTVKEALANASDALTAVIEAYEDFGRPLPPMNIDFEKTKLGRAVTKQASTANERE